VFHGLAMAGVVHALADVSAQLGEPPVVIGGLAVVTRLSTAYARQSISISSTAAAPAVNLISRC